MKKIMLLLLAGSLLGFSSCSKGPKGDPGPTGATGNANVIGTAPFSPNWGPYDVSNAWYKVSYQDDDITTDVVDRGIVQIFKSYGTNLWTPLPDVNGKTTTFFDFYDDGFNIYVQNSDFTIPSSPAGTTFRVVVVYPSQRMAHPNTNWKNYDEAMAALHQGATVTQ